METQKNAIKLLKSIAEQGKITSETCRKLTDNLSTFNLPSEIRQVVDTMRQMAKCFTDSDPTLQEDVDVLISYALVIAARFNSN